MSEDASDLGELLRRLRLAARLSQRDLALRVGFHESGVTNIERGERAPSAQYLESVIAALRLKRSRRRAHLAPVSLAGHDRRHWGRRLATACCACTAAGTLVGVVGASGSGKSSVVFAGVLPRLRAVTDRDIVTVRPGTDPERALAEALSAGSSGVLDAVRGRMARTGRQLLVVIDQFEETSPTAQTTARLPGSSTTHVIGRVAKRQNLQKPSEAAHRLLRWL